MSKNDEIKKLKEHIDEFEFVKGFQQMTIADFEVCTNHCFAKKSLPEKTSFDNIQINQASEIKLLPIK